MQKVRYYFLNKALTVCQHYISIFFSTFPSRYFC